MTILVGYPTNRRAKAVLSLAGKLARSGGEDVVVCTVIRDPRVAGVGRDDTEFRKYADELAAESLARAGEDMAKDVAVQFTRIDARSIPTGLVQAAERCGANTIVVGSAMGRIENITVSSIADRLLHSSPLPVAVSTRGFRAGGGKVRRVTLACAGGEQVGGQLAAAAALAARYGAELRLASFAVHLSPPEALRLHLEGPEVLSQWTKDIHAVPAEAASAGAAGPRRAPEIVIGQGEDWEEALADIEWGPGDLMVIGSSDAGPISRVFLGSRAAKILRHTLVPVMALPRASADAPAVA